MHESRFDNLPEPMWICCWHSMMNRKIELQTAYKEQIAARSGGDIPFVQRQRFAIAQPQKFLCYQDDCCPHGAWGRSLNKRKNHPLSGKENRWFCQSGYQVALLARFVSPKCPPLILHAFYPDMFHNTIPEILHIFGFLPFFWPQQHLRFC